MAKVTIKPAGNLQLPAGFRLSDLVCVEAVNHSSVANQPDVFALANLHKVAALMEKVKTVLGGLPVTILAGFRSVGLNDLLGGEPDSPLLRGGAVRFCCPEYGDAQAIYAAVANSGVKFGEVALGCDWVQISILNKDKTHES